MISHIYGRGTAPGRNTPEADISTVPRKLGKAKTAPIFGGRERRRLRNVV